MFENKDEKKLNISEQEIDQAAETIIKDTEEEGLLSTNTGCVNGSCVADA